MKCPPTGVIINGAELDSCIYREIAKYKNVTVKILRCDKCGHIEIEWVRQPDTEEVSIKT